MTNHISVDPATGVTAVGYNCYVLDAVKNKVFENIFKIEKTLGMKIESTYELSENKFTLKGITEKGFTNETWIKLDNRQIVIEFKCSMFPFSLSSSSKITVCFDFYFNIIYVQFQSSKKDMRDIQIINLMFNKDLVLESMEFKSLNKRHDAPFIGVKKSNCLSSLKDEILYFNLYISKDEEIKELLPEFFVPSAYDFTTQDFSDRLNVLSMLIV